MKLKKVLVHTLMFSPDGVSTAYLYNDIALGLVEDGFEVVVLTTTPHYNLVDSMMLNQPLLKKMFGLYFISYFKGIKVYHIPIKKYKNTFIRIVSFIFWHLASFILALSIKGINFVLSPSPPITIGFVSILIARLKRAKVVYNVQEIYPDLLINNGDLKSSIIIKFLKKFEKIIYNWSDAVVTIDVNFYNTILPRFINPNKLHIIPNFVDTDLYKPLNKSHQLPEVFGVVSSKLKILYAGNIGYFQDWEPVLYSAAELLNEDIEFWIVGDGVQKNFLETEVVKKKLNNVRIFPYQSRDLIPIINDFVDINFISVNQKMEHEGFPSKIYTIMACAKPLIVITGINTPLYNFLIDKNCSILVTEDRNVNFTKAIRKFLSQKEFREELGFNGYKYISEQYSKKLVVSRYSMLLNSL